MFNNEICKQINKVAIRFLLGSILDDIFIAKLEVWLLHDALNNLEYYY